MTDKAFPAWNLKIDTVETYAWFDNALKPEECDQIIEYANKETDLQDARIAGGRLDDSIRKSSITWLGPSAFMGPFYRQLTDVVLYMNERYYGFDIFSFSEPLQFTEYNAPDGNYNYHIDKVVNGPIRKLSIVVQLTDENDYEGGDFEVLTGTEPVKLPRKRGTLLIFPSYVLHRVTPVTKGKRNSLVGWISGNTFK